MTYEDNQNEKGLDIVVRLNNDDISEISIFRDNINLEKYTIDEMADSLIYIYNQDDEKKLSDKDIEVIETELDRVSDLIDEAYDEFYEY